MQNTCSYIKKTSTYRRH